MDPTADNTGQSEGAQKLRVRDAASVTALWADVTIQHVFTQPCVANTTNGTVARADLRAYFFNDSSSTGASDSTSDVYALLAMGQNSLTGRNAITESFFRCADPACTTSPRLGEVTFVTTSAVGQTHTLVLWWDPANQRFTFFVDPGTPTQAIQTLSYSFATTNPPVIRAKKFDVKTNPAHCTAGRTMALVSASFDNVLIGQ